MTRALASDMTDLLQRLRSLQAVIHLHAEDDDSATAWALTHLVEGAIAQAEAIDAALLRVERYPQT